jgi:hypothetical protein
VDGFTTHQRPFPGGRYHCPPLLGSDSKEIGIARLSPDWDGTPFVASTSLGLRRPPASSNISCAPCTNLGYDEPAIHSILQNWFDGGQDIDPNMRTIAIEIAGHDFESVENYPSPQKIANVLSLVWALMKRYKIRAMDLMGHHEIQLNKPDPGKKFMALMRYLIGIKALLEDDGAMKGLVFGDFIYEDQDFGAAVQRYFRFTHDYLLLVSTPQRTYEWEVASGFWHTYDRLGASGSAALIASKFTLPVAGEIASQGKVFTDPHNHEGIDLYRQLAKLNSSSPLVQPVTLVADGICQFIGPSGGCSSGKIAIFQHRQVDGGEVLSVYAHLNEIGDLKVGNKYPLGYGVGAISSDSPRKDPFLHFAIAYGGTWKTDLSNHPRVPLNVGSSWITERYLDPIAYLQNNYSKSNVINAIFGQD